MKEVLDNRWFNNPYKVWGSIAAVCAAIGGLSVGLSEVTDKGPQRIKYPDSAKYIGSSDHEYPTFLGKRSDKGANFIFKRDNAGDIKLLNCDDGEKDVLHESSEELFVTCLQDNDMFNSNRKLIVSPAEK